MVQIGRFAHDAMERLIDASLSELGERSQKTKLVNENPGGAAVGGLASLGCAAPLLLLGAAAAAPVIAPHLGHLAVRVTKAIMGGGALLGAAIESEFKKSRKRG